MSTKETVYLALGANVGEPFVFTRRALIALRESGQVTIASGAHLYRSRAVGPGPQDEYVNTAVAVHTDLEPEDLLTLCDEIEKRLGRIERWKDGPREIDIDIAFFGSRILTTDNLLIPHKKLHLRDFVLRPIADIKPDLVHPLLGKTVSEILAGLPKEKLTISEPAFFVERHF